VGVGETHWDRKIPQEASSAREETNEEERNGTGKGKGELEERTHDGVNEAGLTGADGGLTGAEGEARRKGR